MAEAKKEPKAIVLATAEAALQQQYPHVVTGSLREASLHNGKFHLKRNVQIKCASPGCEVLRRVATSDLAQVKMCEDHTRIARLQRRRDGRAALKAAKTKKPTKVQKPIKAKKPVASKDWLGQAGKKVA
jgi:acetyl-CoA carboxylase beta subunit